jgi:hypothetical protein
VHHSPPRARDRDTDRDKGRDRDRGGGRGGMDMDEFNYLYESGGAGNRERGGEGGVGGMDGGDRLMVETALERDAAVEELRFFESPLYSGLV